MKLLLTSAGFTNKTIIQSLAKLVGKPFSEIKLAFVPTAANIDASDKGWLIDDLKNCQNVGFERIDIVDISALPKEAWEPRLRAADVLMFSGGNTFYLMFWLVKSGLKDILPELLETKVYVGISAGSMVASGAFNLTTSSLYWQVYWDEKEDFGQKKGLGLVHFQTRPHLNSPHFPKCKDEYLKEMAKEIKDTIYALDDQSAVQVIDDKVTVVTEGSYLTYNL